MKELKKKKLIKIKLTKQVIFAENLSKSYYLKKLNILTNLLKPRDAILTSAKETNMQNKNYFVCYKFDHIFKECSQKVLRISALNNENEFNRLNSDSNFDLKN